MRSPSAYTRIPRSDQDDVEFGKFILSVWIAFQKMRGRVPRITLAGLRRGREEWMPCTWHMLSASAARWCAQIVDRTSVFTTGYYLAHSIAIALCLRMVQHEPVPSSECFRVQFTATRHEFSQFC